MAAIVALAKRKSIRPSDTFSALPGRYEGRPGYSRGRDGRFLGWLTAFRAVLPSLVLQAQIAMPPGGTGDQ
jgi:hypothetical protein